MSEIYDQSKILEKLNKGRVNELVLTTSSGPKFSIYKYGNKVHEIQMRKYESQEEFIDEMKAHVQVFSMSLL